MTFQEWYEKLNEQQKQIVDTHDKNILLLASAGTGKTNTLSLRIANILRLKLANENQILCLTFTNRACKEMKERINLITDGAGQKIVVKTFHSFCFEIVKEYARFTSLSTDLVIYDEDDCRELLNELDLSKMQSDNIQAIQRFVDYIKEQRMVYSELSSQGVLKQCYKNNRKKLEQICSTRGNINYSQYSFLLKYGGALVDRYDQLLTERHAVDFNDILYQAKNALEDEDYANYYADRFRFILVDEVQDTSVLEYNIIEKLFTYSNIMMCGDYFQTIYQWRGSKPRDIFGNFMEKYHAARVVFDQSYRSTQLLLNASYDFLKTSFPNQVEQIYGGKIQAYAEKQGEKIDIKTASNIKEEAEWIYEKISQINNNETAAVLCRNNYHAQILSDALLECNLKNDSWIDFLLTEQFKFFRSGEIKDIVAFLKYIVNPYDDTSIARIMMNYVNNVGIKTIQKLESRQNFLLGIRLHDFVDSTTRISGEPYAELLECLDQKQVVVFDVESTGIDTAEDEIIQIAAVQIDTNGNVVKSYERLINPSKSVGSSEKVHHFSDEFLENNGIEPFEALMEFSEFIDGKILVGHNVGYDVTIFLSQLARLKLPRPKRIDYYDTLDMARRFYPHLENHKLETLCKLLDTATQSSHDAMDDILATKDVLIEMIKNEYPKHLEERKNVYGKYSERFKKLSDFLSGLREKSKSTGISELLEDIISTANMKKLHNEPTSHRNMQELLLLAKEVEQEKERSTWDNINEFIRLAALSATSLDRILSLKPRIPIITVHQAKGAEFHHVFLAGLQDDTFPSYMSVKNGDLSEERRTFYVAMTRAKKRLYFSCSLSIDGRPKKLSRFVNDISIKHLNKEY